MPSLEPNAVISGFNEDDLSCDKSFLWMKIKTTQGYYLCVFFWKIISMYLMCIDEISYWNN